MAGNHFMLRRNLLGMIAASPAAACIPAVAQAKTPDGKTEAIRQILHHEIPPNTPLGDLADILRAHRAATLAIIEYLEAEGL